MFQWDVFTLNEADIEFSLLRQTQKQSGDGQ